MIIPNIENLRILSNNVFDDTAQHYIESVVNTISDVLVNPSNSIIRDRCITVIFSEYALPISEKFDVQCLFYSAKSYRSYNELLVKALTPINTILNIFSGNGYDVDISKNEYNADFHRKDWYYVLTISW